MARETRRIFTLPVVRGFLRTELHRSATTNALEFPPWKAGRAALEQKTNFPSANHSHSLSLNKG